MDCPACGFENLPGTEACEECQTSLMQEDVPAGGVQNPVERSLIEDTIEELGPKAPISVPQTASLATAVGTMREAGVGCVLATDGEGRLSGVLSEWDLLERVATDGTPLDEATVEQYMKRSPETAKPSHPLADAIHRMVVGEHRHLALVDEDGRPTGVVSGRDMIRYIALHFPQAHSS